MSGDVLGVVPARLASTRLHEKPLHPVLGRPLLEWVLERVAPMESLDRLVVATDSPRVGELCRGMGIPFEMTSPDHPSGTDRVAEVASRPAYRHFPVVVNVQGDEPLLDPSHLRAVVELVRDRGWPVGTCACPVGSLDVLRDPSAVKVVRGRDGRALYFSRAPIPWTRAGEPTQEALEGGPYLRHLGLYGYTRDALEDWVSRPPSPLERVERLEQLRALEAGVAMGVAVVGPAEPGVDTPADVTRLEARLRELGAASQPLASQGP